MDCLFLDFTYNLLKFHYGDHHRLGCLSDLKKERVWSLWFIQKCRCYITGLLLLPLTECFNISLLKPLLLPKQYLNLIEEIRNVNILWWLFLKMIFVLLSAHRLCRVQSISKFLNATVPVVVPVCYRSKKDRVRNYKDSTKKNVWTPR